MRVSVYVMLSKICVPVCVTVSAICMIVVFACMCVRLYGGRVSCVEYLIGFNIYKSKKQLYR